MPIKAKPTKKSYRRPSPNQGKGTIWEDETKIFRGNSISHSSPEKYSAWSKPSSRANNRGSDMDWQGESNFAKRVTSQQKSAVEIRKANARKSNSKKRSSK